MEVSVRTPTGAEWDEVRALFLEYRASADAEVCFQGFSEEVRKLPAGYACVLIAEIEGIVVGCVALRSLSAGDCEMKRLFVRPPWQGQKLGRHLAEAALLRAAEMGFARMRLDTLPAMSAAIALYRSMGFRQVERYNDNPDPSALFFEKRLLEQGRAS